LAHPLQAGYLTSQWTSCCKCGRATEAGEPPRQAGEPPGREGGRAGSVNGAAAALPHRRVLKGRGPHGQAARPRSARTAAASFLLNVQYSTPLRGVASTDEFCSFTLRGAGNGPARPSRSASSLCKGPPQVRLWRAHLRLLRGDEQLEEFNERYSHSVPLFVAHMSGAKAKRCTTQIT